MLCCGLMDKNRTILNYRLDYTFEECLRFISDRADFSICRGEGMIERFVRSHLPDNWLMGFNKGIF